MNTFSDHIKFTSGKEDEHSEPRLPDYLVNENSYGNRNITIYHNPTHLSQWISNRHLFKAEIYLARFRIATKIITWEDKLKDKKKIWWTSYD